MHLILASTSSYRRQLLERLQHPFDVVHPEVDETPLDGESGPQTAERLALAKARAVALHHPDALVIGSDQVAYAGDRRFGKPGTVDGAIAQLRQMRGQSVIFHTGVAVVHARTGTEDIEGVPTEVRFRDLDDAEIIRYVNAEHVLDCAGSAKSEGLGISLLDALSGDDPTALVGLPLIALSRMLRRHGLALP
ncbi:MAG: septum formation inhibitor Maf [Rhodocyclaceae bacterium]|nr:septum formation inhibitor Maf [Rhodocyclaceae bacterium]